jgi:hypothetical protein
MSRTRVTPGRRVTSRVRPNRVLAAGLAAAIAAGGAAIVYSGDDPGAPSKPDTARAAPTTFGDPPVVKGARGGKTNSVTLRVFGDPMVRKGAGGH